MAVLEILSIPDPRLKVKAEKVTDVSTIQTLIDDMLETLYATGNGIGLASTQVGRKEAVVVIDISDERNDPLILVNPEVVSGENKALGQEGCLSVPEYYADVERYTSVVVSALDRDGNPITIESDEFLAIVMQHEIDHLSGNLFIDYLSPLKQKMAMKKVKKYVKAQAK
ncbi:peptide deformylase [Vibrio parahaemolyticus]|jgi:peptide deformylase|uniref:Peptide deformylase 2 n=9 Tax=Vibrio TaxID=662 RepID=DEF2_VIBPA|nr:MULTISPECIES: peptide deformylase [Vibrio]Q87I22.1 RecName: Full=Peptide deformylase 2; Short=PDF 2; AltName: Full=Polypeptide deformylase 2 [Vibrio parahaemolyticus RIMD 2210633]EFO34976.1 peptide deformylase [Vibrio parahaemolyticus Peru-466]EFO46447.1 peptide deformylase [Vibrio parahaemolyticus AQ4037]EFO51864.1 peptide deformylase [Vibrio parahaemolyticus K5030]EJG0871508.1 peptide deformylase [Vibrio parahaemolyticus O3]EJG0900167.1 peptide deformylase [Vibrio parahaemolyticus O3:K56|eukprot:TRINITY_DN6922_c0_g2_i1.p1 TRINITY_DN6922_c0_g2~~TRINITY_DN6922_c0_g2_i1.p1  ORF type:complete len:169 (-),score=26.80 TRINITY_DN6922_c0_g2_i1:593-1099(-)